MGISLIDDGSSTFPTLLVHYHKVFINHGRIDSLRSSRRYLLTYLPSFIRSNLLAKMENFVDLLTTNNFLQCFCFIAINGFLSLRHVMTSSLRYLESVSQGRLFGVNI